MCGEKMMARYGRTMSRSPGKIIQKWETKKEPSSFRTAPFIMFVRLGSTWEQTARLLLLVFFFVRRLIVP
jgi:hypothetical protein